MIKGGQIYEYSLVIAALLRIICMYSFHACGGYNATFSKHKYVCSNVSSGSISSALRWGAVHEAALIENVAEIHALMCARTDPAALGR